MAAEKTDKQVIDELYDIYEKRPNTWIKGAAAKDSNGKRVDALDPDVCQVCFTGGLRRLATSDAQFRSMLSLVTPHIPKKYSGSISSFNDATKTTLEDVKAVLKVVSTHLKHLNGN